MSGALGLRLETATGAAIAPWLPALAELRIAGFREWPYHYEGHEAYEAEYLGVYPATPDSVVVLAFDGERVVGATSGLPLAAEAEAFRAPFEAAGMDVARVFYLAESVVRPEYRGRGLGAAFFDAREAHARQLGRFEWTAFCAVERAADDPRRPVDHRGNEGLWGRRGYVRRDDLRCRLAWPEIGGAGEIDHTLVFRLRRHEAA